MKKYLLINIIFYLTLQIKAQTVSDVDGNTYNTVTIGTQIWMKENLKTTKYNDGTSIPILFDSALWCSTPAYCWYNNDIVNKTPYGALYNIYSVVTSKLCPIDWHVPTNDEFRTLMTYLGGEDVAGGKLKESGSSHWASTNVGADNSSGFTALPGGLFHYNYFINMGQVGLWWTSTYDSTYGAFYIVLQRDVSSATSSLGKHQGYSVRCISKSNKDEVSVFPNPLKDKQFIYNSNSSNSFIEIFNLQGAMIYKKQVVSNSIDVSSLSSGIYLIKIIESGKTKITKFIKE